LTAASELDGATTLADLLNPATIRLAASLGLLNDLRAANIEDLPHAPPHLSSVLSTAAAQLHGALTPAQRTVIDLRVLHSPPKTLREIGSVLGITHERVRQIHARLETKLNDTLGPTAQLLSSVLKYQLGPVVSHTAVKERIAALLPNDGTGAAALARYKLESELGYSLLNGICLDAIGSEMVDEIHAVARSLADDAGLIDESTLLASLSGDTLRELWPLLFECCSLHRLFDSLATRTSAKARTKAALLHLGTPATREEIAKLINVSPTKVGSYLSNLSDVVRADKSRWGLSDWIDDEYEGIAAEIIQRVEEDGGTTNAQRLFDEIPRKFRVSRASVHAYLQTPRFFVRDGYVSLADPSSLTLRRLDDVIDGRDANGAPYWTFLVDERHFRGHSVSGVPPELVRYAGCAPDGTLRVSIAEPEGCPDLSLRWPLTAVGGATMGYLAAPLLRLGVRSGERVRVTILKGCAVTLTVETATLSPYSGQADLVVTRMKTRRRVL